MSANSDYRVIPLDRLKQGTRLQCPIYDVRDDRNVLLLSAGTVISSSVIKRLSSRGISEIRAHCSELDGSSDSIPVAVEPLVVTESLPVPRENSGFAVGPDSFIHNIKSRTGQRFDPEVRKEFSESYQQSLNFVEDLFGGLSKSERVDGSGLVSTSAQLLSQLSIDKDLFTALGILPAADRYPMRHGLQTSMLAVALGTTLGLTESQLLELSTGCVVHDVGMLHISQAIYNAERSLTPIEFLEITKHPMLTFDLIRDVRELSSGARMVAYQMHERCNSSGYPRKTNGKRIHYLAKVAAVADVFIAMISPRPHRLGMLPYFALKQIIEGARKGEFDPTVVRGLLQTISLFPIGSFIEVSDGRVGRVLRANRENFARPVVELTNPHDLSSRTEIVDLSQVTSLEVVRPLRELPVHSVQMGTDIAWD